MDMSLSKIQELVIDREAWRAASMGLQRVGQDLATELTDWQYFKDTNRLKLMIGEMMQKKCTNQKKARVDILLSWNVGFGVKNITMD